KQRHLKALFKLPEQSLRYPECLLLGDITLSEHDVAGGSFRDVFEGSMVVCVIAVKMLKVYQTSNMEKILKSFTREAVIWRQLSHPNVLPFDGIFHLGASGSPKLCLVSPWMKNGNLSDFLSSIAPEIDCVPLALDVAKGLEYLHSQNVLHADLKCYRVTFLFPMRAGRLADFGLSVAKDTNSILMTAASSRGAGGTLAWTAPELLFGDTKSPDEACDVYSFGMVCYEGTGIDEFIPSKMLSGYIPFQGNVAIIFVSQGRRPQRPIDTRSHKRGLTDQIWELITTCWQQNPEERFTAEQAV
ncbi:kinase-like protein, partial [Athelia psychrophila]